MICWCRPFLKGLSKEKRKKKEKRKERERSKERSSGLNVARYLTISLRGPVLTLHSEARSAEFDGVGRVDGYQDGPFLYCGVFNWCR